MPKKLGALKKKRAAEIIQKYGRGWIARFFYRQFKHIVKLRDIPAKNLLYAYKQHLSEIVQRHDGDDCIFENTLDLREVCDYYLKLDKYEFAFDELAEDREGITYSELPLYFEVLSLTPTKAEIRIAVEKILESYGGEYLDFIYTKDIVVDIALHIYVPKGTHLQNTRKSTWLCPIVGNDDALRFGTDSKTISLGRCMKMVTTSMRAGKEENNRSKSQTSNRSSSVNDKVNRKKSAKDKIKNKK